MKIAIVGTRGIVSRYSGIEVFVTEASKRLAEKGHKITVYCHKTQRKSTSAYYSPNIRLVFMPAIHSKHFNTLIHSLFSTLHVLFSDADIVHFYALGPSLFSFLPRLFGKKTMVTIQGLDWKRKKWGYLARQFLKLCEYCAIYFPNKTVAVSRNLKDYFENKFRKRVDYLPNGIDIVAGEQKKNESICAVGYILFVGRLVPEKGIHYLIKAFNELKNDMRLVIAGAPSFTEDYAAYLSKISGPNVDFLGFVEAKKVRELYKNAYLFVLPSEVEGSPVSLLEAMSYGKCVLVSDIPESLEIIGDAGFSFKSGDYLDLKEKLRYLLDNPEVVNQTELRAQNRIREQYSWGPIINELERLYFSLQANR